MRTWIALGVVLTASGLSYGATPEEQLAEEIAELREQLGVEGAVAADDQGFAAAIAKLAAAPPPPNSGWDAPNAWAEDRPSPPPFDPPQRPTPPTAPHFPMLAGPTPAFPAAFNQPPANRPEGPRPAHYDGGPPQPKHLLRRTAAELDRLANELEVAELYRQADALRDSAGMLRNSARRMDPQNGMVRGGPSDRDPRAGRPPRLREGDIGRPPRPERPEMAPPQLERDGDAGPARDERRRDRDRSDRRERPERSERPDRPDRPERPGPRDGGPGPGPR